MHIRVLTRQTRELVCLHHHDEASAELEVPIPNVDSRPNGHVSNSGDRVVDVAKRLSHDWSTGWCKVTSSSVGGLVEEEATWDRFFLRSASRSLV
jgi:hypothetical protein